MVISGSMHNPEPWQTYVVLNTEYPSDAEFDSHGSNQ